MVAAGSLADDASANRRSGLSAWRPIKSLKKISRLKRYRQHLYEWQRPNPLAEITAGSVGEVPGVEGLKRHGQVVAALSADLNFAPSEAFRPNNNIRVTVFNARGRKGERLYILQPELTTERYANPAYQTANNWIAERMYRSDPEGFLGAIRIDGDIALVVRKSSVTSLHDLTAWVSKLHPPKRPLAGQFTLETGINPWAF